MDLLEKSEERLLLRFFWKNFQRDSGHIVAVVFYMVVDDLCDHFDVFVHSVPDPVKKNIVKGSGVIIEFTFFEK